MGLFRVARCIGEKALYARLKNASDRSSLIQILIHEWLATLDATEHLAVAILVALGYNHPKITQAVTSTRVIPPAPWNQQLEQNWIRAYTQWRHELLRVFNTRQADRKQVLTSTAAYLCQNNAELQGIELFLQLMAFSPAIQHLEGNIQRLVNLGLWEHICACLARLPTELLTESGPLQYASGEINTLKGNLAAATQAFLRAGNLYLRSKDGYNACRSFLAVSALAHVRGDERQAWVKAMKARRVARASGLSLEESWAEFQLGYLSIQDRDAHIATHHFTQAVNSTPKKSQPFFRQYFDRLNALALARQEKQDEGHWQYLHYLDSLQEEAALQDHIKDLVEHPGNNAGEILSSVSWSRLPLMIQIATNPIAPTLQMPDKKRTSLLKKPKWARPFCLYHAMDGIHELLVRLLSHLPQIRTHPEESPCTEAVNLEPIKQSPAVLPGGFPTRSEHAHPISQQRQVTSKQQYQQAVVVTAYLLGDLRISIDDQPVEQLPGGNSGILLRYFLHHHKRSLSREELMELLWPEVDPNTSRNRLNVTMSNLRKELRNSTDLEIFLFENERYFINPEIELWVDVDEFESTLAAAVRLEAAGKQSEAIQRLEVGVNLYKGTYLQEETYEEWLLLTRERLHLAYLDALNRLARFYFQQEQFGACADLCHTILEQDNCREDVHRLLMRCYARQGLFHLGIRQYQACQQALQIGLDIQPATTTKALYARIRRREITQPPSTLNNQAPKN